MNSFHRKIKEKNCAANPYYIIKVFDNCQTRNVDDSGYDQKPITNFLFFSSSIFYKV